MTASVDRDEVVRLGQHEQAQVIEVLPRTEYLWAHLDGAAHLWLGDMDAERVKLLLDPGRPVVVYCNDFQCDLSSRAAWRLERMGFPFVYDYEAGKMDWLAFGLPHDGDALLVGEVARRDVPACRPKDALATVRCRLEATDVALCPVLDDRGVVLGAVHRKGLEKLPAEMPAEEVMDFGVATIRPSAELYALLRHMERASLEAMVITRPDGTFFGLAVRSQVRRRL